MLTKTSSESFSPMTKSHASYVVRLVTKTILSNCRKNNEVKSKNDYLLDFNEIITHNTPAEALVKETPPSTSADETVNSLQYPALPIHISLDDKPMDRAEIINPPVDILTLPTPPFPPNDKQTESSQEKIEHNLTPILLNGKNKRPISEASLPLNSPSTTNLPTSPIATNKHTKKKLKSVPGRALSQT